MAEGQSPTFGDESGLLDEIDEYATEHVGLERKESDGSKSGSNSSHSRASHLQSILGRVGEGSAPAVGIDAPSSFRDDVNSVAHRAVEAAEAADGEAVEYQCIPTTAAPPPTYEEAMRASTGPFPPPSLPPSAQQRDSNVVVAEARRLGLDSDFLAALPQEMALEILEEKRRENALLYDNGTDNNNAIDASSASGSLSTLSMEGPNPAAEDDTPHSPVDGINHEALAADDVAALLSNGRDVAVGRVLTDNNVAPYGHGDHQGGHNRRPQQNSQDLSVDQQDPRQGDVLSLSDIDTMSGALSEISSSSSRSDPSHCGGRHQYFRDVILPNVSSLRITNDVRTNNHQRRRRQPRMMRAAITNLLARDEQRAAQLRIMYGLSQGRNDPYGGNTQF